MVAYAQEGATAAEFCLGYRDVEQQHPVAPTTVFGLASITKVFTAVAILPLHDAGKLSAHDRVVDHLPEFRSPDPDATRTMTIHHLLTHSAGFPPLPTRWYTFARSLAGDPAAEGAAPPWIATHPPIDTYEQLLAFLGSHEYHPTGPPGQYFSYSNEGFALLGAIIERTVGEPYPAYVKRHILDPAGMEHSTFDLETVLASEDVVTIYAKRTVDGRSEAYHAPRWWHTPTWLPAGCLYANSQDVLRFLEIFRTRGFVGDARLLSSESVALMTKPHVQVNPRMWCGYAIAVTPDHHGVTLLEHSGGRKGISSHAMALPEIGVTGVALANIAGVPVGNLLASGLNAFLGLPIDTPRASFGPPIPSHPTSDALVGEYRNGEGSQIRVSRVAGQLVVELRDGAQLPAVPLGDDQFVVRQDGHDVYCRFIPGPPGQPPDFYFRSQVIQRADP